MIFSGLVLFLFFLVCGFVCFFSSGGDLKLKGRKVCLLWFMIQETGGNKTTYDDDLAGSSKTLKHVQTKN